MPSSLFLYEHAAGPSPMLIQHSAFLWSQLTTEEFDPSIANAALARQRCAAQWNPCSVVFMV
jgi:hypothetical protein